MSRAEQRAQTRIRLLEAAREVFEAHGFDDAHLRAVAERAGVATGTVFVHFRDKRDLLHAALFEDLEGAIEAALATAPDGLEPWCAHVSGTFFDHYAARPALSKVLLRESLISEPPWSERFQDQVARVHAAAAARFEAARVRGEVEGDAALFGVAFVSFYTFALLSSVQGGPVDPRRIVGRLVAQHLAGARP